MGFSTYKEFKNAGVEWLGKLPAHWEVQPLKAGFSLKKRPPPENCGVVTAFRDGEVTLRSNRRMDGFTEALQEIGYQGVEPDDLVIHAMDAFAGAIGVSDSRGKSTPVYSVCEPKKGYFSKYYGLVLRHIALAGFIQSLSKGIRERSTDFRWSDAKNIPVPHPSIQEQKLIINFLDHETTKIDKLVAEQEKLIELLKEKIQAVISNSITKGIDSSAELIDPGVKWLGKVPKHWKLTSIKHNSTIIGRIGFRGYTKEDIVDEGEGAITLSPSNLIDGDISLSSCTFISWEKFHESPEIQIAPGDVVMVKTGSSYGKVAIFDNSELPEITINPQLVIFKKIKIDSKFFFYFLKSTYVNSLIKSSNTGGTIPTLTQEFLGNIKIVIPTIDEQKLIVGYLNKKSNEFNMLIRESEKVITLLNERKATLISAAVTGQIDVRDYQIKEAT